MCVSAASVLALTTRPLVTSFGPAGTSATADHFERPATVGVDSSSGATYVADIAARTVQKFNAAHKPEAFTGSAPNIVAGKLTGFSFEPNSPLNQIAVNTTTHDFYVADFGTSSVKAFHADGEPSNFTAGPGAGTNAITGPLTCGVAVDSNGDIYAGNFSSVEVFAPSGALLTTISAAGCSVAVDSHGTVYVNQLEGPVEKLTPSEFPVTPFTTYASAGIVDANTSWGVVVDPVTDHLFVDEHTLVAEYDETGARTGNFANAEPGALTASQGVAVNSASGEVYASDAEGKRQVEVFGAAVIVPEVTTTAPTEIGPTSATLQGTVNPSGVEVTSCRFDYGTSVSYGQSAPCEQTVGSGSTAVAVSAKLTGLVAGTTYHVRLQAENAGGVPSFGGDVTFSTLPPPVITAAVASNLTPSSAKLGALVNPGGLDTSYRFEYGTSGSYGLSVPVPDRDIGAGVSAVAVSAEVTGLTAGSTYHWRVVAHNEAGTTVSPDHTFVYAEVGGGLSDGRAYEMVTPPQKDGAVIGDSTFAPPPDVSADGSHIILGSLQCFGHSGSCVPIRQSVDTLYEFTRTPSGWTTNPLSPPATQFEANTWFRYNADASTTLFTMPTAPHGEDDFYARTPDGAFHNIGPLSPPSRGQNINAVQSVQADAATADLLHVVFLTEPVWPFGETGLPSLFQYSGLGNTAPTLVGVMGGPGSTNVISSCGTLFGDQSPGGGASGLSADGSVVFFKAMPISHNVPCPSGALGAVSVAELFARVGGARTVAVSEPDVVSPAEPNEACVSVACVANTSVASVGTAWRDATFEGASGDGSRAFFTSQQQLTDTAGEDPSATDAAKPCALTVGLNGCNLYEFEGAGAAGGSGRRLVDVSGGDSSGGGPRVQGVLAVSGDGSHVYFVAKGVLTGVANARGEGAQQEKDNLYVFERDAAFPGGRVVFVAVLPGSDAVQQLANGPGRPANVSPDGRFLVFTSGGLLTGDDSRVDGGQQVFRYDALTGVLVRISVGQDGFNDNGNVGAGDAFIVPGFLGYDRAGPGRGDPTMSDDGSFVFFMSPVALTQGALGSVQIGVNLGGGPAYAENVYEWHNGVVSLISDGRDTSTAPAELCFPNISAVCLIGSDTSGRNVFFSTTDRLVSSDTDTQLDVYDARVCSLGDPCIRTPDLPSPPCLGEQCHGTPPATPSLAAPGSASFSGVGNLAPVPPVKPKPKPLTRAQKLQKALKVCRRNHNKGRRVACEVQARKKYGPLHKAKKTSTKAKP
jgi:hypothetical protein